MDAPLLRTKLYAPRPAGHLVPRARLLDRLRAATGGQLVLVSAPAGYGKSALVAEWLRAEGRPAAWVSLDAEDSAPQRFWSYVAAALAGLDARLGESLAPALHPAEDAAAPEALLAGLVNALLQAPIPLALVLDDYHLITGADVHRGVEFLSSHLPPTLTLVISGRADPPWPLARRRARGELVEVRAADLRFTREEAAAFLNDGMELGLSPQEVGVLSERTEGWIVGLQMAALSLRGHDDVSAYLQALSASDRYILDYLLEEVLERQPPVVQEFLLATAILRRLSAPLCAAVTGREDAATILAHLETANLFLVALDGARHWYRYHHLFADLLGDLARARCAERLPEWHARAGAWWEAEGHPEEAIHHALEGQDAERAARLVRAHTFPFLARGEARAVGDWFARLLVETIRGDALLSLQRAWLSGPREDIEPWVQRVLETGANEPPLPGLPYASFLAFAEASIGVLRAERARHRDEPFQRVLTLALEAYERVPTEDVLLRAHAANVVGRTFLQYERVEEAERWFAMSQATDRPGGGDLARLVLTCIQAQQLWNDGYLHRLATLCERALAEHVRPAEAAGRTVLHACHPYVLLGRVRLQWNESEEAERLLMRGLELAEREANLGAQRDARRALATLRCAQGRFDEALSLLDHIEGTAPAWSARSTVPEFVQCLRARVWVWRAREAGDTALLERAIRWADGVVLGPLDRYSFPLQSLAWVRIAQRRAQGAPDLGPLIAMLRENLAPARPGRGVGFHVEVRTLVALALDAEGARDEALAELATAVEYAAAEGFSRHLLDHGEPLLALLEGGLAAGGLPPFARTVAEALRRELTIRGVSPAPSVQVAPAATPAAEPASPAPGPASAPNAALPEPLTERELEILRYLNGPLSSTEIAEELYLSPNTVRFHMKHLYDKLDAHSRREAVERAQAVGLL